MSILVLVSNLNMLNFNPYSLMTNISFSSAPKAMCEGFVVSDVGLLMEAENLSSRATASMRIVPSLEARRRRDEDEDQKKVVILLLKRSGRAKVRCVSRERVVRMVSLVLMREAMSLPSGLGREWAEAEEVSFQIQRKRRS